MDALPDRRESDKLMFNAQLHTDNAIRASYADLLQRQYTYSIQRLIQIQVLPDNMTLGICIKRTKVHLG